MDLTLAIEVLADEIKDKQRVIYSQIEFWSKEIENAEERIKEHRNKLGEEVYPLQIALSKLRELNTVCEKCGGTGLTKQYCIDTDSFEDDLCEDCGGIKKSNKSNEVLTFDNCPVCEGKGMVGIPNTNNLPNVSFLTGCNYCGGKGKIAWYKARA